MDTQTNEIDLEWLQLIREAIEIGISIEEIKNFFKTYQTS